jgi:hypothetical protein
MTVDVLQLGRVLDRRKEQGYIGFEVNLKNLQRSVNLCNRLPSRSFPSSNVHALQILFLGFELELGRRSPDLVPAGWC